MKVKLVMACLLISRSLFADQVVCETHCEGTPWRILFKQDIYAGGLGGTDELVEFKIKCRDQGGQDDTGVCGYGDGTAFGILTHYCVVPTEKVSAIGRAKSDGSEPLFHTKGVSRDRCEAKLKVQPDCETSAGIEWVTIVNQSCQIQ